MGKFAHPFDYHISRNGKLKHGIVLTCKIHTEERYVHSRCILGIVHAYILFGIVPAKKDDKDV